MNDIREIVCAYVVISNTNVVSISTCVDKTDELCTTLKDKVTYRVKKINTHLERLHQITNTCHFYNIEYPLNFRNKVILDWHSMNDKVEDMGGRVNLDKTWEKIKSKYGIELSVDDFSQAMFDLHSLCLEK